MKEKTMKHKEICIAIVLSVTFEFSSHAQQDNFPVLTGPYLGQTPPRLTPEVFTTKAIHLHSDILNEERQILIHLPNDYKTSSGKYPVMIILDAEDVQRFAQSIAAITFYSGVRRMPKMIIVGIPNTNRTRDISPYKIKQRPSSGGGRAFLEFITLELFSYLEEQYRCAQYRILFGGSSAGTFTLYSLCRSPELINAFIASRPALNSTSETTWDSELFFSDLCEFLKTENYLGKSLYIDYGGREDDFHDPKPIHRLTDVIMKLTQGSFRCNIQKIKESGYRSAESLANGLLWIFKDWYYPADSLYIDGFKGIKNHAIKLSSVFNYPINVADILSEDGLNMFGYRFLEQNNIDEAIHLFRYTTEMYPESWNIFESLGEAYMQAGEKEEAVKAYKKSLILNPNNKNVIEQLKLLKAKK